MHPRHFHTQFRSPLGTIDLVGTERGLTGLFLEDHRHGPTGDERGGWQRDDGRFAEARQQLAEYFAGERRAFTVAIDREGIAGTAFQRRVWAALEGISHGETVTYGELARRIGQPAAVRAVGLANGRNPLSILVPCHRVIGANGTLTGYGGGVERKRWLLELESGTSQLAMQTLCPYPAH